MAHFFISVTIHNSEFRILNSEFRIPNSEFWINLIDTFIYYIILLCKAEFRIVNCHWNEKVSHLGHLSWTRNGTKTLHHNTSINPVRSNGISQSYQLNQSISVLRVAGLFFFIFIQILIEYSIANSGDPYQMTGYVASYLGQHCLHTFHKRDARLIWVKQETPTGSGGNKTMA